MTRRVVAGAIMALTAACAGAQNPPAGISTARSADSMNVALIPAGFGSLRQEDIALKLQLPDVLVKVFPLDESVIRVLSTDSYRAMHELAESKQPAVARIVAQHNLLRGKLWYVSFYGLATDARFSPMDLTITVSGQDFRPVDIVPLRTGFGNQRLQPRDTQDALYVFDDALDVNQPLTVSLGSQQSTMWSSILRNIEQERAAVRSRSRTK